MKKIRINLQKLTILFSALLLFVSFAHATINAVEVSEELVLKAGQVIGADKVNVLEGPTTNFKVVGTVKKGSYVTITTKESNGYYRIRFDNGKFGYIPSKNVNIIFSDTAFIQNGPKDVRLGPGTEYQKIGTVQKNEMILILGIEKSGYYKILYNGSTIGYVLDTLPNEVKPTHIVFDMEILKKPFDIIKVGSTFKLIAQAIPLEAKDRTIYWSSSNPKVATVNSNGVVTGKSAGEAQIIAKTSNGVTATRNVRIVKSAADEAVKRANFYLVNYGVGTKNAAKYATDDRKMYLEAGYSDNKRYADTSSFPWFCYTYAGVNLGHNKTYPSIEEMAKAPGNDFKSYNFKKVSDLKPGDLAIWINYNKNGSDYVAIYVGKDNKGADNFIDMGLSGIQKRSFNSLVNALGNKLPTNYVRCVK